MKHISKSKIGNCFVLGAPLEVELLKKCTLLCREARFDNTAKTPHVRTTLHVEASFCVAGAMGSAPCQKCTTAVLVAGHPGRGLATARPRPRHGHPATRPRGHPATATRPYGHPATQQFCSSCKNGGRRGVFEGDLPKKLPGRRSTRDIFIRDVRRSGR